MGTMLAHTLWTQAWNLGEGNEKGFFLFFFLFEGNSVVVCF